MFKWSLSLSLFTPHLPRWEGPCTLYLACTSCQYHLLYAAPYPRGIQHFHVVLVLMGGLYNPCVRDLELGCRVSLLVAGPGAGKKHSNSSAFYCTCCPLTMTSCIFVVFRYAFFSVFPPVVLGIGYNAFHLFWLCLASAF